MNYGSKITGSSKTVIGLLLVLLPLLFFFVWRNSYLNEWALSRVLSSELNYWKKSEKLILQMFNSSREKVINPGFERDVVLYDSTGERIYGYGNRFSFPFEKLKHITQPSFIETEQGVFLSFPFNSGLTRGIRGYGLTALYYTYSDENNYFKSGPSSIVSFLGDIRFKLSSYPGFRYLYSHKFSNGCYISYKNPFKGKEIFILLFVFILILGFFILTKQLIGYLKGIQKGSIFIWILSPCFFISLNHLIFITIEYTGIEFYDKYILVFQYLNLSYYEIFLHLFILNYFFLRLWEHLRFIKCHPGEYRWYLFVGVLLFIILVGVLNDLLLNYDFIRYLSYYASGKLVLFNYLIFAFLISGILLFSINWLIISKELGFIEALAWLVGITSLFCFLYGHDWLKWWILGFTGLLISVYFLNKYFTVYIDREKFFSIFSILTLGLSILSSVLVYYFLQNHEKHRRFLLLTRLESIESGDPILFNGFIEIAEKLASDSSIIRAYHRGQTQLGDSLIINKYFTGIWKQFSLSLTYCTSKDKIRVNPSLEEYDCFDYFAGATGLKTEEFVKKSILVPVEQGNNIKGYLGFIKLSGADTIGKTSGVFLEFSYANFSPSFCFGDVFYSKGIWNASETVGYSFARYFDGKLISHSGSAWFPDRLYDLGPINHTMDEFSIDQYQYTYLFNSNNKTALIIARSENNLVKFIGISSANTFLVIILSLICFLLTQYSIRQIKQLLMLLRVRLQMGILGIVFLILFVMSLILNDFYVTSLVQWTQRDIRDKVHSLSLEIDSRLERSDQLLMDKNLLFQWLLKLSNIYFLDIIYYNSAGVMQISTVPQVENKRFFNGHLHFNAYKKIILEGLPYFAQEEKLGSLSYYAVYFPVKTSNKLYGVASIPVVAGKPELDKEYRFYSSMMVGLILFLLLVAMGFAFLLSGLVVIPLKRLSENISRLKIGMRNEKIDIRRRDEIGELSQMYNNLVDELETAILELRRKERELAWKDVARQIAHEIKNPLTPIKLQIQFLHNSFNPVDEQWKERFKAFSGTLLEKIEELTRLANTFSEIAVWPSSHPERTNFTALILNNVNLSLTGFCGKIVVEMPEEPVWVDIDKYQMGRVIDNLLKNARQAIPDELTGVITVKLEVRNDEVLFSVRDNGTGITQEQKAQIFLPNFTTKSFGMGLGLFISRNIVLSHGGEIEFTSEPGLGTTFTVRLPYKRS
ncbi:MAG: ATP-binding protein [Bacteroidales bacterium]